VRAVFKVAKARLPPVSSLTPHVLGVVLVQL
jgi:hypothetical protein